MPGRRRRRRESGELLGSLVVLALLFAFIVTRGNPKAFGQLLMAGIAGLVAIFLGLILAILAILAVKGLLKRRPGRVASSPSASRSSTPDSTLTASLNPNSVRDDLVSQLRAVDWYQFEKVVGLAYEARGYTVQPRGGANPDGGIDLVIERGGERTAVQCKHWKKWKVRVPLIREFIGALHLEGVAKGIIVTLQESTSDAERLAAANNIEIVRQDDLARLINELPDQRRAKVDEMLRDRTKRCPKCESFMVLRTPRAGDGWKEFWGCQRYPVCQGKLEA